MAIENSTADLNYGGETVLNNFYKGILGTFQVEQQKAEQQAAIEQKRIDQENAKVEELISGINPEGIRPNGKDAALITQDLSVARELAYKMYTAESEADRVKYRSEIQSQLGQTRLKINKSKQLNKTTEAYAKQYQQSPWEWVDNFSGSLKNLQQKGLDEITEADIAPENFMKKINGGKITDRIDKLADDLLKRTDLPTREEQQATRVGTRSGTKIISTKEVPVEIYAERLIQEYIGNGEFKAYISQSFPQMTPQEAIQQIAQDRLQNGYLTERKEERVLNPVVRATGGAGKDREVPQAQYGVPIGFANSETIASVYQPVKSQNVALSRASGVDLESGQPVSDITGDIDVSGLAKVPILNKDVTAGGNRIPRGSIATPEFARNNPTLVTEEDYFIGNVPSATAYGKARAVMIPVERFPTTTKQIKEDLNIYRQASGQRTQSTPTTPQTKPTALDLINKYRK